MTIEELKTKQIWIVWRLEEKDGKPTKIPYNYKTGFNASTTDSDTWGTYQDCKDAYDTRKKKGKNPYSGLGLVFSDENLFFIDIDHFTKYDGKEKEEIYSLINDFDTYKEISQSGEGIHIICLGELPPNCSNRTQKTPWLEMYGKERYCAFTENELKGFEGLNNSFGKITNCQEMINKYANKYLKKPEPQKYIPTGNTHVFSDEDLIKKALKGKNADLFERYYYKGYEEGEDKSGADLGFCNILAFYTCKDFFQMDRIFRSSALFRPKWNEKRGKRTYGEATIQKAIDNCTSVCSNEHEDFSFEIGLYREHQNKKIECNKEPFDKEAFIENYKKYKKDERNTSTAIFKILESDPELKGLVGRDNFSKQLKILKKTPWNRSSPDNLWNETDDSYLRMYLEQYMVNHEKHISDAFNVSVDKYSYHPVKEYLDKLIWDGQPRLENLFVDYLGCENSVFNKAVTKKMFVAGIKRIYEPGCKFDCMLILKGEQGIGKSTLIDKMGGEWFNDSLKSIEDQRENVEQILNSWVIEFGELTYLKNTEVEKIKSFLSQRKDKVRLAYDKRVSYIPRQCVFFGTTNNQEFLKDQTGNRRFWIVECGHYAPIKNVWEDLSKEVDQIWAEAKYYYNQKEDIFLNRELEEESKKIQEQFKIVNIYAEDIDFYLDMKVPDDWERKSEEERITFKKTYSDSGLYNNPITKITTNMIYYEAIGGKPDGKTQAKLQSIKSYLKSKGWKEGSIRLNGKITRGFTRPSDS